MRKLTLIAAALTVAGCNHIPKDRPDAARLVCEEEPGVPTEPVTDEANADYLKKLRAAGADCRGKLKWVRDYFDR